MRWEFASANSSGRVIIKCSIRLAPRVRSRPPPPSAGFSASGPTRCSTPSARRAPRPRAYGNSCATPPNSKPLHTAHAAASGLTSAYLAQEGFTGAKRILTGAQGMAAGMAKDAGSRPSRRSALGDAVGVGRNLLQVPRVVPAYPSGRRRAVASHAGECAATWRHQARHGPRPPGGHRRAGPCGRSADGASGQVLDGRGARPRGDAPQRRHERLPGSFPRSGNDRFLQESLDAIRRGSRRTPIPSAGSARSRSKPSTV